MRHAPMPLAHAIAEFYDWLGKCRSKATLNWYRHFLERFRAHVGNPDLHTVTQMQIEKFSSDHHPLAALRGFFRWCRRPARFLSRNPMKRLKVPKKRRRKRVLSPFERIMIRRRSGRSLRHAALGIEEGGLRPQEMRAVRWDMIRSAAKGVDFEADLRDGFCYFEFDEFKDQDKRADQVDAKRVPITPRLGRLLSRLRRRATAMDQCVFLAHNGRPWTANAMRCAWRRMRDRLKLDGRIATRGLVPYLLRHYLGTDLFRSGESAFTVRDWLGHRDVNTTAIYVHSTIDDLIAAGRRRRRPPRMNR